MKKIPLTQGKFAIVDDEDYERLSKHKWYAQKTKNTWYAVRTIGDGKEQKTILMHREILNIPKGFGTDHINHNGVDNKKGNIRRCNQSQNLQNKRKTKGTSRYKGVSWYGRHKKWYVQIVHNGQWHGLGYYDNEILAAKAYDRRAKELFGEFACLNFGNVVYDEDEIF